MLDLQQLLLLLEYKSLGNHRLRHIREVHGLQPGGLCSASIQREQLLVPTQHDHYRYECACAHPAMSKEKPAK
jgi:hypothetical protein